MRTEGTVASIFGPDTLVYSYTRAQALEDGVQVRLTGADAEVVEIAGWKDYPVFLTAGVEALVDGATIPRRAALWKIFFNARWDGEKLSPDLIKFAVNLDGEPCTLMMQVGPVDIDNPQAAFTVMFPEER